MLYKYCEECAYRTWLVGLGQGVVCANRLNWKTERPPQISSIENCQYYEPKDSPDQKTHD